MVLLSNIQSFGKSGKTDKTSELELVLKLNKVQLGIFTETWLDDNTCKHLEIQNYVMFHSVRNNALRASGGVSVFVMDDIPATKMNIKVPEHLEVIYVNVRPKWLPRSISNIIVIGVYYPGSSSKYAPPQDDLIQHLKEKIHHFYSKYADPLIMLMGDFNDLVTKDILKAGKLKQVVKVPTRKEAILDLIMINKGNTMYKNPITLPSIRDSDHLCVLLQPKEPVRNKVIKEKILIRKFKKSSILAFGYWITRFDWSELFLLEDVNDKVAYFTTIMWIMVEKFFPLTPITVTNADKEWVTPSIKKLISQRQKAHKVKNYKLRDLLAKKIKIKIKKAKLKYHKKRKSELLDSGPKEWYRHISNILGNKKNNINLTNIPELPNKSIEDQVKIINTHFANICKKYPALDKNIKIDEPPNEKKLRRISELETFRFLNFFCKKSLGPGDLPKRILKEFALELATPFCDLINCAIRTGVFPDAFKKAEIIAIPKVNPPRSLSDLRPISKTAICGKMIEKVMMSELQKDVKGKLDLDQYGNTTGSSTTHYLIKLTDQAQKSTDKGNATTAITIDYSKAFDYVDHSVLIEKLVLLGVRAKLINLIISFLSDRSHNTKLKGKASDFLDITCGVPQGTVGGPKLFVILINGIKCHFIENYKFVDDKTLALSYSGDPSTTLQKALDIETIATNKDKMIINELKCNIINFNFSQKNVVPQNLKLNDNVIESVKRIKLLGVIITDNLKWEENTSLICSKVESKFYILSKLKSFGLNTEELINIWKTMIRPITEYACPLWHSALSEAEIKQIEDLQKTALGMILGTFYIDFKKYYKIGKDIVTYEHALQKYGLTTLLQRREVLTQKFALQTVKHPNHRKIFEFTTAKNMTTRKAHKIQEKFCETGRYYKSAVPYMSRILNGVFLTEKQERNKVKRTIISN